MCSLYIQNQGTEQTVEMPSLSLSDWFLRFNLTPVYITTQQ